MFYLNEKNIDDLIAGLSFFATGGGGIPERGKRRLLEAFGRNGKLKVVESDDLDDDMITLCTFYMGSASPDTPDIVEKRKNYGFRDEVVENPLVVAIREMEDFLGIHVDAIVALETGAGTTSGSMAAASTLGKMFVDGDYAGRAVPEIYQTTPYIYGKRFTPMVAVDRFGNTVILKESGNVFSLERIGKMLSESSFTSLGMAGILMLASEMREVLVGGTVSRALEVGGVLNSTRDEFFTELRKKVRAYRVFQGRMVGREWRERDGYMEGFHTIAGDGRIFRIWFRNENHIGILDGRIVITSPDLIVVLDSIDHFPLNNTTATEGIDVTVLGVPADEKMRHPRALEVLGPGHFGFTAEYRPVEALFE